MSFVITSSKKDYENPEKMIRVYWCYHVYCWNPKQAKRFRTWEEAEAFKEKRLENGWADCYRLTQDIQIVEVPDS